MPTVADYVEVDGKWLRNSKLDPDNGSRGINQINQPIVRVDDYSEQSLKVLTVEDVMRQKGEGIRNLWGDFLHEKSINLLSGEAGVGKTTLGYNIAIKAAKEEEFYDPHKMALVGSLACVASSELYTFDVRTPNRKWNE